MASINQLVSEIAHSLQQPNNVPLREAIRLAVMQSRAKLIRHNFEQHNLVDKVIQQRFKITLIDCPDGDLPNTADLDITKIKRSAQRVPRPARLSNGIPFLSVRTTGFKNPFEIAYASEAVSKFYQSLPGFCPIATYDYINQYLYINVIDGSKINDINTIIVESPFDNPFELSDERSDGEHEYDYDDEFMISEDMVGDIKKLVLETIGQNVYETNQIPTSNLVK